MTDKKYTNETVLTNDEVAVLLTSLLGRNVSPATVYELKSKKHLLPQAATVADVKSYAAAPKIDRSKGKNGAKTWYVNADKATMDAIAKAFPSVVITDPTQKEKERVADRQAEAKAKLAKAGLL